MGDWDVPHPLGLDSYAKPQTISMSYKLDALFHGEPPPRIEKVCLEPISEASVTDYKIWLPILRAERYLRTQVETCLTTQNNSKVKRLKPSPFPLQFECFQYVKSPITALNMPKGAAHITFEVHYEGGQRTVFFFRESRPCYREETYLFEFAVQEKLSLTLTITFTRVGAILWGRNKLKIKPKG